MKLELLSWLLIEELFLENSTTFQKKALGGRGTVRLGSRRKLTTEETESDTTVSKNH